MPKLQEYIAPSRELRPDNSGYQAFETAGRRVGGMFREAGANTLAKARAEAATLADKAQWPFTLFALKQKFQPPKPAAPAGAAGGGVAFNVRGSRGTSYGDAQFAPRIMPNLYAANLSNVNEFYNPLSAGLSPEGAHQRTLADEAARLSNQLKGLVGSAGGYGGVSGPGPNADAEASANAYGQSIAGVPVPTGYGGPTPPAGEIGGDYGGGGDAYLPAPTGTAVMPTAPGPGTIEILNSR